MVELGSIFSAASHSAFASSGRCNWTRAPAKISWGFNTSGITYSGFGALTMLLSPGNDTLNVTSIGVGTTITAGQGTAHVNVSNSGHLNGIVGHLTVNGIGGGHAGVGGKAVIPAEAWAKVSFRLVSDQDPDTARRQVLAQESANALLVVRPDGTFNVVRAAQLRRPVMLGRLEAVGESERDRNGGRRGATLGHSHRGRSARAGT